jgi:hypothetical protein
VSSVASFYHCWHNANNALTDENYSKMLVAWSKLSLYEGANANFGDAKYFKGASTAARAVINAVWGTITDGGQSHLKYPTQPGYIRDLITKRNISWNNTYLDDM